MATNSSFKCRTCGFASGKWMGFCPQCGSAEPLVEGTARKQTLASEAVALGAASQTTPARVDTGWSEVDRVLGGGLVAGSAVLLGGEPGVGKSTLLLQIAGSMAERGLPVLIASGEESVDQIALRASRLGISGSEVSLVADDDVDAIVSLAEKSRPVALIVDSIQTVGVTEIPSAPGGVAQVRESAARLIRIAKTTGMALILVGHVTKDGGLAGPKLLEHMVDVVLYLEGDPDRGLRILRSNKNRFGATHVSGMFDMTGDGMIEVADPSQAFLNGWESEVPGTVVYPAVEGRRSVLVEVQALVAPTRHNQPRRSVRGLDPARVNQVIAVLQRHTELQLQDQEVYVNVVGGWRLDEPGCDLAVALAIASSAADVSLGRLAAWGEVGLAGEVRPIPMEARRIEELERMGLKARVAPESGVPIRIGVALSRAGLGDLALSS